MLARFTSLTATIQSLQSTPAGIISICLVPCSIMLNSSTLDHVAACNIVLNVLCGVLHMWCSTYVMGVATKSRCPERGVPRHLIERIKVAHTNVCSHTTLPCARCLVQQGLLAMQNSSHNHQFDICEMLCTCTL
jgi:hypothetical protein